nr:hypothetical protein [Deltaproteobacteria bacterium]
MTSRSCRFSVVAAAVGLVALLPSACGKASTPRPGGEAKTAAAKTPAQTKAVDTKTADTKTADTQTADTKTADSPPAPTGRLKVSPGPDFAVVVHSKGIEVLDPKGGSAGMLVNEPVAWCKVDDRARLLWFVAADAGGLFALDLEGTGPAVPVLTQTPETIVIDYPGEPSGVPDGSQFEEGVVVHMETPPRREAAFGCDGDMVWSCFDEPGDDEDFDAVRKTLPWFRKVQPITTGSHATLVGAMLGYRNIILMGIDCQYIERVEGSIQREGTVLKMEKTPDTN